MRRWATASRWPPPLRVYVEAPGDAPLDGVAAALRQELNAQFAVVALPPGALPPAEQKSRTVYRTARGDTLPEPIEHARRRAP
jgi:nucleoid-associated protein YgaU